jgi:metal-responsive CopG/Arc/MetJ family transcriptional regulator
MKRVNITMPDDLAKRIDSERGDVTRSLFIRRLLEKVYRITDGAKK